jgi:ribosome-binding factor A
MNPVRKQKLEALFSHEIAKMILAGTVKDPRVSHFSSVSNVSISNDLSFAKVYMSSFESWESLVKSVNALNHAAGFIQGNLGKKLKLRQIPKITFLADDSIKEGMRINEKIDSIVDHSQEHQPPKNDQESV